MMIFAPVKKFDFTGKIMARLSNSGTVQEIAEIINKSNRLGNGRGIITFGVYPFRKDLFDKHAPLAWEGYRASASEFFNSLCGESRARTVILVASTAEQNEFIASVPKINAKSRSGEFIFNLSCLNTGAIHHSPASGRILSLFDGNRMENKIVVFCGLDALITEHTKPSIDALVTGKGYAFSIVTHPLLCV